MSDKRTLSEVLVDAREALRGIPNQGKTVIEDRVAMATRAVYEAQLLAAALEALAEASPTPELPPHFAELPYVEWRYVKGKQEIAICAANHIGQVDEWMPLEPTVFEYGYWIHTRPPEALLGKQPVTESHD